jgi:hypothetical protein
MPANIPAYYLNFTFYLSVANVPVKTFGCNSAHDGVADMPELTAAVSQQANGES